MEKQNFTIKPGGSGWQVFSRKPDEPGLRLTYLPFITAGDAVDYCNRMAKIDQQTPVIHIAPADLNEVGHQGKIGIPWIMATPDQYIDGFLITETTAESPAGKKRLNVLIACEYSGRIRDAFIAAGHNAVSCDLLDTDRRGPHYKGNVVDILDMGWDLMIAHPPCTYLTCSAEWAYGDGPYHQKVKPGTLVGHERRAARREALNFVLFLSHAPIPKIVIENPVGALSSEWREPDQYIQPYEYGDDASKKTCLWIKGLPNLKPNPADFYPPRLALTKNGKGYVLRWGNQTDSGQNRETPGDDRWKTRSTTWQGWADAMASQWG